MGMSLWGSGFRTFSPRPRQPCSDLGKQTLSLSFFSCFSSAPEAVWGLRLKVLVHPGDGDEGPPPHACQPGTAKPRSRHSPKVHRDIFFLFNALLLPLLPQPRGVGCQPAGSRGCFPALPRKRSSSRRPWGERDAPPAPPHPREGYGTLPISLPPSPFAASQGTSFPHKESV